MGFLDWLGRKWAKKLDFTKVDSVLKAEALAAEGKLAPLHLVPLRFGGQDMPMNRVFVPVSVVNRKDHYAETIEGLVKDHRRTATPAPLNIETKASYHSGWTAWRPRREFRSTRGPSTCGENGPVVS